MNGNSAALDDRLQHLTPDDHGEVQFAEIVRKIPKTAAEHQAQLDFLRTRVARGWRAKRILDAGCGEGKFTKLVLELLAAAGALVAVLLGLLVRRLK